MSNYMKFMKKRDFKTDTMDASPEKGIRKEIEEVVRRDKVSKLHNDVDIMLECCSWQEMLEARLSFVIYLVRNTQK